MRMLAGDTDPKRPQPDSSVAELQRTLKAYSQLVGYPAADPGEVTGIVNDKTALAVLMIIPRLPKLPDEVRMLAQLGPLALANDDLRSQVVKTITSYAGYISGAIIAAQAYQAVTGGGAPGGSNAPGSGVKTGVLIAPDVTATSPAAWAATTWQATTVPGGGAVPTNPGNAIFFWDFWTQSYRVAVPRGAGLGAGGYVNYVEVSSAKSRPATGTEVNRNTFMSATGKWWGTTGGIIGLTVGAVAAGAGAIAGVRALRR